MGCDPGVDLYTAVVDNRRPASKEKTVGLIFHRVYDVFTGENVKDLSH